MTRYWRGPENRHKPEPNGFESARRSGRILTSALQCTVGTTHQFGFCCHIPNRWFGKLCKNSTVVFDLQPFASHLSPEYIGTGWRSTRSVSRGTKTRIDEARPAPDRLVFPTSVQCKESENVKVVVRDDCRNVGALRRPSNRSPSVRLWLWCRRMRRWRLWWWLE